ncbi:MAG TPA: class II aldolase/adducin family protein, partial [Albitalea sp.]|nr:class II aldolase/adducin family protein [Albitalea sp.]
MILRNHGTLTAGRTVGEAFVLMYRIERACRMQIAAQSGGQALNPLPQAVIDKSIECGRSIFSKSGFGGEGQREWSAMLRKLEREGSDHAR